MTYFWTVLKLRSARPPLLLSSLIAFASCLVSVRRSSDAKVLRNIVSHKYTVQRSKTLPLRLTANLACIH